MVTHEGVIVKKNDYYFFVMLFLFSPIVFAQQDFRNYLWNFYPEGQTIKLEIDDIHSEKVTVSPKNDWGYRELFGQLGTIRKKVKVAVIDTGVDVEHPELKDQINYNSIECLDGKNTNIPGSTSDLDQNGFSGDCLGWNFSNEQSSGGNNIVNDEDGHGTHVASIIGSLFKDDGLSGFGQVAEIIPIKVFGSNTMADSVNNANSNTSEVVKTYPLALRLKKALEYAKIRGAQVINLSLGWPKSLHRKDLEDEIKLLISEGVIIVAAAGNNGNVAQIYPCIIPGVICVGSSRPDFKPSTYSNFGINVDFFAPGERILGAFPIGMQPLHFSQSSYERLSGTSQAAPLISGIFALLRGLYPNENSIDLIQRVKQSSIPGNGISLGGMIQLKKSLMSQSNLNLYSWPKLKGQRYLEINSKGEFSFTITFEGKGNVQARILTSHQITQVIKDKELKIGGKLGVNEESDLLLEWFDGLNTRKVPLDLLLIYNNKDELIKISQNKPSTLENVLVQTPSGMRSQLKTVSYIGNIPRHFFFYFIKQKEKIQFLRVDEVKKEMMTIGYLDLPKGCSFLRTWQIGSPSQKGNRKNPELMVEGLCDEKKLAYFYFDENLVTILGPVYYSPEFTLVNYNEFQVTFLDESKPPVLSFINDGIDPEEKKIASWESSLGLRKKMAFQLGPIIKDNIWNYQLEIKDGRNFRLKNFLSNFQVKILGSKIVESENTFQFLYQVDQELCWVSPEKKSCFNPSPFILTKITPFQVSDSHIDVPLISVLGKNELQIGFFAPFMDKPGQVISVRTKDIDGGIQQVISIERNRNGLAKIVLKLDKKIMILEYDHVYSDIPKSYREIPIESYEFLPLDQLVIAFQVVNRQDYTRNQRMNQEMSSVLVEDFSKINADHYHIMNRQGRSRRYGIHSGCITQNAIYLNQKYYVPLICKEGLKIEYYLHQVEEILKNENQ